jgi:subtilisin family serine protease
MRGRRTTLVVCCAAVLAGSLLGASATAADPDPSPAFVPGELVVRFQLGVNASEQRRILAAQHVASRRKLRAPRAELVRLEPGASVEATATALERRPEVRYAEPNFLYQPALTPNDFYFADLWGMHSTADDDIDMPEAWDLTTGSTSVTVAVVDTGVAYSHPDLTDNIWLNAGETANGADDDGNGLVDDVRGWDFAQPDSDPTDSCFHGTHVAGTIGARGNNSIGVTGVNWQTKLLVLRAGDCGGLPLAAIVDSFEYACAKGAKVINGSFGGPGSTPALRDAIESCPASLFVFGAGNGGADGSGDDIDSTPPIFPCAYDAPNILCVAASDSGDTIATFSNYGSRSVDLAAPGVGILSTEPGGDYIFLDGTSMATPHVAGVAALVWSRYPSATPLQVKYSLTRTVDPAPAWAGLTVTGGRLNAYNAVAAPILDPPGPPPPPPPPPPPADSVPPSNPSPVSTSHPVGAATAKSSIVMAWNGAFDQGTGVDGYSFHWDKSSTTEADTAKDAEENATGAASAALPPGTYYFHLRTRDNAGNWSPSVHAGPYVVIAAATTAAPRCVVPRLKGKTLRAARTALTRARCRLGRVRRVRSRRVGRVLSQSPRAGTRRPRGAKVNVTLGRR